MRCHDLANDEEPEAKAARAPVALLERLEQKGEPVSGNWVTVVPDRDNDVVSLVADGRDGHRASTVLDGIGKQVRHRPLYPRLVPLAGESARGLDIDPSDRMGGADLLRDGMRDRAHVH
ncbi:MAG TPA: hypothetical protein VIK41_24595 [Gemmatimonadaceae bacterium]